jgi:hypothetical protein
MTLTESVAKNIIQKLIKGQDYRIEIVTLINAEFLQYAIDFFNYKCEVKLMGRGNPESADAVIARDSKIFIADKLSDTNKRQLDSLGVEWVELRSENGFKRFADVLRRLNIPYQDCTNDIEHKLFKIFKEGFK